MITVRCWLCLQNVPWVMWLTCAGTIAKTVGSFILSWYLSLCLFICLCTTLPMYRYRSQRTDSKSHPVFHNLDCGMDSVHQGSEENIRIHLLKYTICRFNIMYAETKYYRTLKFTFTYTFFIFNVWKFWNIVQFSILARLSF